jgi:hypothetical protein
MGGKRVGDATCPRIKFNNLGCMGTNLEYKREGKAGKIGRSKTNIYS